VLQPAAPLRCQWNRSYRPQGQQLEDLVEQGLDTLIDHKDTAVKVLVHP
jgi:hypothetical protein